MVSLEAWDAMRLDLRRVMAERDALLEAAREVQRLWSMRGLNRTLRNKMQSHAYNLIRDAIRRAEGKAP